MFAQSTYPQYLRCTFCANDCMWRKGAVRISGPAMATVVLRMARWQGSTWMCRRGASSPSRSSNLSLNSFPFLKGSWPTKVSLRMSNESEKTKGAGKPEGLSAGTNLFTLPLSGGNFYFGPSGLAKQKALSGRRSSPGASGLLQLPPGGKIIVGRIKNRGRENIQACTLSAKRASKGRFKIPSSPD
jgi:hypothetical protein